MKIKIKKFNDSVKTPKEAHAGDYGYDVYAVSEEEVAPNVWKYGLKLAMQPIREPKYEGKKICIDFRCRSSVWKTGMVLSNCIGTIDEIYTGEVKAVFYHIMPNMPRYKVGDKIGQLTLSITEPMEFIEVESLDKTDRGDGGFGSTGSK